MTVHRARSRMIIDPAMFAPPADLVGFGVELDPLGRLLVLGTAGHGEKLGRRCDVLHQS